MNISLSRAELFDYISCQINNLFPDKYKFQGGDVDIAFETALERLENCINVVNFRGYHDENGNALFSHLHSDQYSQFIYFLGNSLWEQSQNKVLCDKLLQLNRVLFSVFISYKCELPAHFVLMHPIGTILGNATYNDFLVVLQGVTVNTYIDESGNHKPLLGKGLFLGAHSQIIGGQPIGDRVSIGAGTTIYNTSIPDDHIAFFDGQNGFCISPRKKSVCFAQNYFNVDIS